PPTPAPLPRAAWPRVVPAVRVVPAPPPPTAPAPRPEATHTVTAGEPLWSIAATTVVARTGRSAETLSPAEVAPYWGRVVEDNRDRLRSGNPSLVYPGEVLELPPL